MLSVAVPPGERVLTLLCGQVIPPHRLGIVLRNALAVIVHDAEVADEVSQRERTAANRARVFVCFIVEDDIANMCCEPSGGTDNTHPTFCYGASMSHRRHLTIIATVATEKLNA